METQIYVKKRQCVQHYIVAN